MDYPLAEAILGFVGGSSLDLDIVRAHHEYAAYLEPLDAPAFTARLVELLGVYDPDVVAVQLNLLSSHDAPRALTVLGGDVAAFRMATLLQCLLPGAPSIYYGDEIGMTGGNDPACRGAYPWDRARWDGDLRAFVRAVLALRAAEPAVRHGSTARGRGGRAGDRDRAARSMPRVWSSRSMPATTRSTWRCGSTSSMPGRLEPVPFGTDPAADDAASPAVPIVAGRAVIADPGPDRDRAAGHRGPPLRAAGRSGPILPACG